MGVYECVKLCYNNTLFINTSGGPDSAQEQSFSKPRASLGPNNKHQLILKAENTKRLFPFVLHVQDGLVVGRDLLQGYFAAKSLQSCLTLCDPIDSSPPGSPVPGILQARTLEWAAISFSNA